MSLRVKNIVYTVVLLLAVFLVWKYRQTDKPNIVVFKGTTMGPIQYKVSYFDERKRNFKPQVDSLLKSFNDALSTYVPNSEISRFNRDSTVIFESPFFYPVLKASEEVYNLTDGAYDPTVMPLVNTWGFGPDKSTQYDSAYIDSLMQFVGFDKLVFTDKQVAKKDKRVQLDFSASAKGYGVDIVIHYLQKQGITNMLVEIGGEVSVKGINQHTEMPWQIGILDPDSDELNQFYIAIVGLSDMAMATSGNYFNYYIKDGKKYSHTISPVTGFPIVHPLLSATVFAEDCMTADAMATAFMVMGHEQAIKIIEKDERLEGYLIYNDPAGNRKVYVSGGIAPNIKGTSK